MKALLLALLASCWSGTNVTVTRIVPVAHFVHDVPRTCVGLPAFPSVSLLGQHVYVGLLARWVTAAGACLNVATYPIDNLITEVTW